MERLFCHIYYLCHQTSDETRQLHTINKMFGVVDDYLWEQKEKVGILAWQSHRVKLWSQTRGWPTPPRSSPIHPEWRRFWSKVPCGYFLHGTQNIYLIDTNWLITITRIYCKSTMLGWMASSVPDPEPSSETSTCSSPSTIFSMSSSSTSTSSFCFLLFFGNEGMRLGIDGNFGFLRTKREFVGTIPLPPNIWPNREFSPWKRAPKRLLSKMSGFWSWFPSNSLSGLWTRVWMTSTGCLDCCGGWIFWLNGNPGPNRGLMNGCWGCWSCGARAGWNGTKIGSGLATGVARVTGSNRRYVGSIFWIERPICAIIWSVVMIYRDWNNWRCLAKITMNDELIVTS